jgi:hypothetical protein
MKAPYAVLFALAVWYLVAPPKMLYYGATIWNMDAAPAQWVVIKSFDSAQSCEQWKADADDQANQIRPTFDVDHCVASDDDTQSVE